MLVHPVLHSPGLVRGVLLWGVGIVSGGVPVPLSTRELQPVVWVVAPSTLLSSDILSSLPTVVGLLYALIVWYRDVPKYRYRPFCMVSVSVSVENGPISADTFMVKYVRN